uniref:Uncharacterized protein n=1 Tax=Oryza brachyantha TaxID=4533 RepID=J3N192_ORYBR
MASVASMYRRRNRWPVNELLKNFVELFTPYCFFLDSSLIVDILIYLYRVRRA